MIRLLPILLIGLLAACGQKGALYLPPEAKPAQTPAATTPDAGAAQPASPDAPVNATPASSGG